MSHMYPVILLLLAVTLGLAVWGLTSLASGASQQRKMVSRSVLDESDRRSNNPMLKLDAALRRTSIGYKIHVRIQGSGLRIRLSTFMVLMALVSLLAILIVWKLLGPVFALASVGGVAAGFMAYLRQREERRKDEFVAQLPELARVLSNATSAGLAVRTALAMAAEELSDPAGTELRRVSDGLALGQSFDSAVTELNDRLPSRELAVLASTLVVSARSGGSLVTALRNIAATLEERKETRREVKTIVSEAVGTGWVVAGIGVGSLFMMALMMPGSIQKMTGSIIGIILLAVALSLFAVGLFFIRRLTRVDI